jgi:hypothetical protein
MSSPALLRRCLLAACLTLAAPTSALVHAAPAPTAEAAPSGRFTLEVRHGEIIENGKSVGIATVGSILEYLKKQNHDFSLALSPDTAGVPVGDPVLQMNSFDLNNTCLAIATAASEPMVFDHNQDLATLSVQPRSRQVAVFNLSSYLNPDGKADEKAVSAKLETLTQIILRTMRDATLTGGKDDPTFQFHAGANLLVVTGNDVAIDIATKVVNALTRPTSSTAKQGGFIPEGAPNPDPAQWMYTPGATGPRKAQDLATLNQLEQALNTLQKQALQQNNLTSDNAKALEQRMDEVKKLLQDAQQTTTPGSH